MITHILASGCSFTSDGIGGVPPTKKNPDGGCSFIHDDSYTASEPRSWVSVVAQKLKVNSLVNVSAESHGNILIANNIMSILNKFKYDPKETMVMFNISDPGRLDVICDYTHPDACLHCSWDQSILPFKYLSRRSQQFKDIEKTMGIDQIELLSSNMLLGMMSFLQQNGFNFRFMVMSDFQFSEPLTTVVTQFCENMIELTPGPSMSQFVNALELNLSDGFHPDITGHAEIANHVLENLHRGI
jgi:hypothetical protein